MSSGSVSSACFSLKLRRRLPALGSLSRGVGGAAAQEMLDFLQNGTPIPEKTAVGATIVVYGDDLATIMPEYAG